MTFMVTYLVEGNPIGKGRPRFAKRGKFVSTYTPTKTRDYESLIKDGPREKKMGTVPYFPELQEIGNRPHFLLSWRRGWDSNPRTPVRM